MQIYFNRLKMLSSNLKPHWSTIYRLPEQGFFVRKHGFTVEKTLEILLNFKYIFLKMHRTAWYTLYTDHQQLNFNPSKKNEEQQNQIWVPDLHKPNGWDENLKSLSCVCNRLPQDGVTMLSPFTWVNKPEINLPASGSHAVRRCIYRITPLVAADGPSVT